MWIVLRNSDFILISSWVLRGVWYSFVFHITILAAVWGGISGAELENEPWPGGSIGGASSHPPKGWGSVQSGHTLGLRIHPQAGRAQETPSDIFLSHRCAGVEVSGGGESE